MSSDMASMAAKTNQEVPPPQQLPAERHVDATMQLVSESRPAHTSSDHERNPLLRDSQAPFYPNALQYWVLEDEKGRSKLVSQLVPGCRHWRIGDPNVDFCVQCNEHEGGPLLGCRTCKRSYHESCLSDAFQSLMYSGYFYCQTCTSRGWNIDPPRNILPISITPALDPRSDAQEAAQAPKFTADRTESQAPKRQLLPSLSLGRSVAEPQPKPAKRRSRYQTVPDEVDQAMSTIYRELEQAAELKTKVSLLYNRVNQLEQEQRMQAGQFALEREQLLRQVGAGNVKELDDLRTSHNRVLRENEELRNEVEREKLAAAAKTQEVEQMKSSVRKWLDK